MNQSFRNVFHNGFLLLLLLAAGLKTTSGQLIAPENNPSEAKGRQVKVLVLIPSQNGANSNFNMDDMLEFGWDLTLAGLSEVVTSCYWSSGLGNSAIVVDTLITEIADITYWDVLAIMPATAYTGNAYDDFLSNRPTLDLVASAVENGLIVWATCAGVRVLAAADVINGVNVTGHQNYQSEYLAAGANYLGTGIQPVIDGNIVTTTRGMYFHTQNIEAIATALESKIAPGQLPFQFKKTEKTAPQSADSGNMIWSENYGDSLSDGASAMIPLDGGGFFVTGYTFGQSNGLSDIRCLWLNNDGEEYSGFVAGTPGNDYAYSVCQSTDGDLFVAGYSAPAQHGMKDFLVINIQPSGNIGWQKCYGGSENDFARGIYLTPEHDLLICGTTFSFGAGEDDILLLKTDVNGNLIWQKTFGGSASETGQKVLQSGDGNYLVLGTTGSIGAGNRDVLLIKTDTNGNQLWEKTYGTSGYQCASDIIETNENELMILGSGDIHGVDFLDIYLVKTDADGNQIWAKEFNCASDYYDYGRTICQMTDGNFMVCSMVKYPGSRQNDVYLLIIDTEGNELWSDAYGGTASELATALVATNDGGFVFAGQSCSWNNGEIDTWAGKIENPLTKTPESAFFKTQSQVTCSPNPFSGFTNIVFTILQRSTLLVIGLDGKILKNFGQYAAGTHEIVWYGEQDNGQKVAAGNYLLALKEGDSIVRSVNVSMIK